MATITTTYFCFFCTESKEKKELYPYVCPTLCEFLICKKCVKEFHEGFEEWSSEKEVQSNAKVKTPFLTIPDFDLKEPASVHKAAMTIQPNGFRLFSPWNYKFGVRDALLKIHSKLTSEESN